MHGFERPEIERLNDGARLQLMLTDLVEHQLCEHFWGGRVVRMLGETFGFDIVFEATLRGESQNLIQSWDAGAGHWTLLLEARILEQSAVILAHLLECQRADQRIRLRPLADLRVQVRIVRDHQDAVFGNDDIHFEHVRPDLNRVFESRNGVLRVDGTRAAVPMHENPRGSQGTHDGQAGYREYSCEHVN